MSNILSGHVEEVEEDLYSEMKNLGLTDKQVAFVVNYCNNGYNRRQAYLDAGYSNNPSVVKVEAHNIVNKPKVREAIKIYMNSILDPIKDKLEHEIVNVYMKRAFYDISTFIDGYRSDGSLQWKALDKVPKEWRCVIDGVVEKRYGKEGDVAVLELNLCNRDKALERLDKYIAMIKPETKKVAVGVGGLDGDGNPTSGVLLAPTAALSLDYWSKQVGGV